MCGFDATIRIKMQRITVCRPGCCQNIHRTVIRSKRIHSMIQASVKHFRFYPARKHIPLSHRIRNWHCGSIILSKPLYIRTSIPTPTIGINPQGRVIDLCVRCHNHILRRHLECIRFCICLIGSHPAFPVVSGCRCCIDCHSLPHRITSCSGDALNACPLLQYHPICFLGDCGNIACDMVYICLIFNITFCIKEHPPYSIIVICCHHFVGTLFGLCNRIDNITHAGIN